MRELGRLRGLITLNIEELPKLDSELMRELARGCPELAELTWEGAEEGAFRVHATRARRCAGLTIFFAWPPVGSSCPG